MLGKADLVAFVPSTDLAGARAFYEGVLGVTVSGEDDFALVLNANGVQVRVTKVPDFQPQPFTALGWAVRDIERDVAALRAADVALLDFAGLAQDGLGIWTSPDGSRVAWFKDQDGNTLSLTQLP